MSTELDRVRPVKLTLWPMEAGGYGLDATWSGPAGYRQADTASSLLSGAGFTARLLQEVDGRWTVRAGPMPRAEVLKALDAFLA